MKPRVVKLHIKELMLEGVAPGDRYRISEELQRELSRLFHEKGVPASLRRKASVESIDAGALRLPGAKSKQARMGVHVARAIYGGLK